MSFKAKAFQPGLHVAWQNFMRLVGSHDSVNGVTGLSDQREARSECSNPAS